MSKQEHGRVGQSSARQNSRKQGTAKHETPAPQANTAAIVQQSLNGAGVPAAGDLLHLQRSIGNRAVGQLLARRQAATQSEAKLTVGAADDPYEREAERVASQVMSSAIPSPSGVSRKDADADATAQRTPLRCQTSRRSLTSGAADLDLAGSFDAGQDVERQISANRGGGSPLPPKLRSELEPRFGADFSNVRVHTGAQSDSLNRKLGAQAFTHNNHIYMGAGKYNPDTGAGTRLLAHELTHVVQQTGTGVRRLANRGPAIQRFTDNSGHEINANSLSKKDIENYLQMKGLGSEAYSELKQALRAKSYKSGIDEEEAREKRRETTETTRKEKRQEKFNERRRMVLVNGYPAVDFGVDDEEDHEHLEDHRIYAAPNGSGGGILMIASIPLPVGAFISELDQRFKALEGEYNKFATKKNLRGGVKRDEFDLAKSQATTDLTNANGVFATPTSSITDKLNAEKTLAAALHQVITKAHSFAKRLGSHFNKPGNRKDFTTTSASHYVSDISQGTFRYNIEGLVAKYEDQPDYLDSGFERDHQPHNDLIETMAGMPEFKGKMMEKVAAGRTLKGWAILLHHDRHSQGRTYGNKGGEVTAKFHMDLNAKRKTLKTDDAVRDYCVKYLIDSMKADVHAIKTVAADMSGGYPDVEANPGMNVTDKTELKKKIKTQIDEGENRVLLTESLIEKYKD